MTAAQGRRSAMGDSLSFGGLIKNLWHNLEVAGAASSSETLPA